MNYALIVQEYIREYRSAARAQLRFYASRRSLQEAIRVAALCRTRSDRRHPHQYRIPERTLRRAEKKLQKARSALRRARSFSDLHRIVEDSIGGIVGIGPLAIYDIAHRIGAWRELQPEEIYLHAGTKTGARSLRLSGKTIRRDKLPRVFWKLSPAELEDCLCIYSDALGGVPWKNHRCILVAGPC